jgi:hypothetical protein
MNVPMNNGIEQHRRHPSPPATADNERIQGGGGSSSFRNAACKGESDQVINTTNEDEDALLTFHPVDEPELEVVVSNIFSVSSLAKVGSSSCDDDDDNDNDKDKEDSANRKQQQQKKRPRVDSHVPIYISDEECDDSSFRRGDDADADNDEEEESSVSSVSAAHERDVFHRLVKEGAAKVAAAEAAKAAEAEAAAKAPSLPAPEEKCAPASGGSDASKKQPESASEGNADSAKVSGERASLDDVIDEEENQGCGDEVEYDYEDEDDDYETRKRREEASMDEEQLRKKRRVEEEERVARNNLWRQSIKRSMFLEPPGSIMSKRATL